MESRRRALSLFNNGGVAGLIWQLLALQIQVFFPQSVHKLVLIETSAQAARSQVKEVTKSERRGESESVSACMSSSQWLYPALS